MLRVAMHPENHQLYNINKVFGPATAASLVGQWGIHTPAVVFFPFQRGNKTTNNPQKKRDDARRISQPRPRPVLLRGHVLASSRNLGGNSIDKKPTENLTRVQSTMKKGSLHQKHQFHSLDKCQSVIFYLLKCQSKPHFQNCLSVGFFVN